MPLVSRASFPHSTLTDDVDLVWNQLSAMSFELPELLYALPRNPAIAVGLPIAIGSLSGLITRGGIKTWYNVKEKPVGEPPRWAFPVMWTLLYASMGVASHLLVSRYDSALPGGPLKAAAGRALKLYWAQYGLNIIWTPLFFGLRQPVLAFIDIAILTPLTYRLTYEAAKLDERCLYLLAPYCAWLTYASYLNAGFWWVNFGPGSKKNGKKL